MSKYKYEEIPVIKIYHQTYLTQIDSENEDYYFKLKDTLNRYWHILTLKEAEDTYFNLLNYCIKKLNHGSEIFLKEFFDLYKMLLDKEIILPNGELNPWNFKNVVMASLRLGEYSWTEKFINEYKDKLPTEFRNNAVSYNLGLVYFYQKKFDKVKEQLREVEYEDISYNLGSKSMLIAIYYEQDDFEALLSLCDTFKTYLNRHKDINEKQRFLYINYIQFVRKLTKIMPGDDKAVEQLKQEIKDAKGVASEKWLLEKLAELE